MDTFCVLLSLPLITERKKALTSKCLRQYLPQLRTAALDTCCLVWLWFVKLRLKLKNKLFSTCETLFLRKFIFTTNNFFNVFLVLKLVFRIPLSPVFSPISCLPYLSHLSWSIPFVPVKCWFPSEFCFFLILLPELSSI